MATVLKKVTDLRLLRPVTFREKLRHWSLDDRIFIEVFLERQPTGAWTKQVTIGQTPCDAFTVSSSAGVYIDIPIKRTPMGTCERSEAFKKLAASTTVDKIRVRMEISYELFSGTRPIYPTVIDTVLPAELFARERAGVSVTRIARSSDPCPADSSVSCEYIDPLFGEYLFCRRGGCQNKKLRTDQIVTWQPLRRNKD